MVETGASVLRFEHRQQFALSGYMHLEAIICDETSLLLSSVTIFVS